MKDIRINILAGCLIGIVLFSACSVTKHLPEDEILYTGGKTVIVNKSSTRVGETALTEINAALAKTPSTTLLGGFLPIPFKMWMYNDFVKYKKGFGKWMFNRFAANPPVFISTVNPEVRVKVATNLLRDYGYFNGKVTYETLVDKKDSLKASLLYTVDMKNPYFIDTVYYQRFTPQTLKIMERGRRMSYITPGEQFNVVDLDEERSRISTLLRNRGYFYFRPDYMTYQADTTLVPGGHISLRLIPLPGLPAAAQRSYYVGDASVYLFGKNGEAPNDSILYKNLNIHYYDKLQVRPNMLYRWMNYQQFVRSKQMRASNRTRLYSQYRQEQVQEKLSQLGIFSYMDMQYAPRDTTAACDTLDVTMQATFAKPLDAELELNVVTKSNDQTGPGASFSVTRNNVFGGGETWNVKLKGSYEWQTGQNKGSSLMNSWEMGVSTALTLGTGTSWNISFSLINAPLEPRVITTMSTPLALMMSAALRALSQSVTLTPERISASVSLGMIMYRFCSSLLESARAGAGFSITLIPCSLAIWAAYSTVSIGISNCISRISPFSMVSCAFRMSSGLNEPLAPEAMAMLFSPFISTIISATPEGSVRSE